MCRKPQKAGTQDAKNIIKSIVDQMLQLFGVFLHNKAVLQHTQVGLMRTIKKFWLSKRLIYIFVELGGGVGDVPFWCRDRAYVEFGFR